MEPQELCMREFSRLRDKQELPSHRWHNSLLEVTDQMFSPEQLTFFDVFGFLLWRKAFSPAEIERISEQFREVLDHDRHGGEFSGDKRHSFNGLLEQREDMYWWPRITGLIAPLSNS